MKKSEEGGDFLSSIDKEIYELLKWFRDEAIKDLLVLEFKGSPLSVTYDRLANELKATCKSYLESVPDLLEE